MESVEQKTESSWRESPERELGRRRALLALIVCIVLAVAGYTLRSALWVNPETQDAQRAFQIASDERAGAAARMDAAHFAVQAAQTRLELEVASANGAAGCGAICNELRARLGDAIEARGRVEGELASRTAKWETAQNALMAAESADSIQNAVALALALAVGASGPALALLFVTTARSRYREREALQHLRQLAVAGEGGEEFDVMSRLRENDLRLRTYHELVTNYASGTRTLTLTALIAGLVFVAVCGISAALSSTIAGAVAGSVAAASISAMTGFVVSAVLKNSEASSQEVRAFFLHPIEQERTLTAERLIGQLDGVQHDSSLEALIAELAKPTVPRGSASSPASK